MTGNHMKQAGTLIIIAGLNFMLPAGAMAVDAYHTADAKAAQNAAQMTEGEVRKVDKDAGKITIKHGPIDNLKMPAMTMVFRAQDPAMLDQVKAGDKIRFRAEDINGALMVVRLESAR